MSDDLLKEFMAADKRLGSILVDSENKDDKIIIDTLNTGEATKIDKIEINVTSLNKEEVQVREFIDKKGHYHKPHKRKVKGSKDVPKSVPKKPMPLTPDNVKEILSLEALGMKGGIHHQHTHILKLKDDSHAIYKDMDGEEIFGETSAYKINKILDWDTVPETVANDFGKGKGTAQRIIENGKMPFSPSRPAAGCVKGEQKHFDDFAKIFVLDLITGNNDRTGGNVVIANDKAYAIDNELFACPGSPASSLKVLDELTQTGYFDRNTPTWGDSSPMFAWLALMEYDNSLVIKHIKHAISKKSDIVQQYTDYEANKGVGFDAPPDWEITNIIKENFDDMEKYINKYEDKT